MISSKTLDFLYEPIRDDLSHVHNTVLKALRDQHEELQEIDTYTFQKPGKMLRPALAIFSGLSSNPVLGEGGRNRLVLLGSVLELLHTASLIHDDVLDGDTVRRSLPSLNAMFGSRIAVLAGDVLFSRAFGILSRNFPVEITDPITQVTSEMCHGEILSAVNHGKPLTAETYNQIIDMKTARFTAVSCYTGALVAGASPENAEIFRHIGAAFGTAYQLLDDWVDSDVATAGGPSPVKIHEQVRIAHQELARLDQNTYTERLRTLIDNVKEAVRAAVGTGSG